MQRKQLISWNILLRSIVLVVVLLFTWEVISPLIESDTTTMEMTDVDLDDNQENEDETDDFDDLIFSNSYLTNNEDHFTRIPIISVVITRLNTENLLELPSPPPEFV